MTDGHKPTDKKIYYIQLMAEPKDFKQLQSFLGTVNYLNRYSPTLAEITAPPQDLTKDNGPFIWGPEHTDAFHATSKKLNIHHYLHTMILKSKCFKVILVAMGLEAALFNMGNLSHMSAKLCNNINNNILL